LAGKTAQGTEVKSYLECYHKCEMIGIVNSPNAAKMKPCTVVDLALKFKGSRFFELVDLSTI